MIAHICGLITLIGVILIIISVYVIKHNPKKPKLLLACFITATVSMVASIIAFAIGLFVTGPRL